MPDSMSQSQILTRMKVIELKTLLAAHGLSQSGRKADLMSRASSIDQEPHPRFRSHIWISR
jgi:hypothetical protein